MIGKSNKCSHDFKKTTTLKYYPGIIYRCSKCKELSTTIKTNIT